MLRPICVEVSALACIQNISAWSSSDAWACDESLGLSSISKLHERSVLGDLGNALVLGSEKVGALTGHHSSSVGPWHLHKARNLLLDGGEPGQRRSVCRGVFSLALVGCKITFEIDAAYFLKLDTGQLL